MSNGRFNVGDTVRRRSQPESVGVILRQGYLDEATGQWIYRVQFGNGTKGMADTELELLPEHTDAWDDIRARIFGDAEAFRALMTFERLRRPPSPIAASFGSAKAAFYPFQFKPLLKFLENPKKRLLIADDVGLGKTVEAGYIIRELRSRVSLDRVLLVVPSRLRTKWQNEMTRRFGERFEIVAGRDISTLREKMERHQQLDRFSWIVSIESARADRVIQFLDDLQPSIDVVVVDEAHRMRNSGTKQHQLGKALSACAEHMIMLTATPVQTGLDNLFRLLNILDESQFQDSSLFEDQCAANRPIVRAAAAIRSNPPAVDVALNALEEAKDNPYTRPLTQSRYFSSLVERCSRAEHLDRDNLVALQRDINELSLTGKIISRTRKAEVLPDRTVRSAQTVQVRYSEAERVFYDSVAELFRVMRPDLWGWGQTLAALQWFRATASCIPAAASRFRDKLEAGLTIIQGITPDFDEDAEGDSGGPDAPQTFSSLVHEKVEEITAALEHLTEEDTKYECLTNALHKIWREDEATGNPLRKVVLFAYFKPTLAYLETRLNADDVSTRLITGDVAIPEREVRIDDFASDPDIRVLLSSEVGSEGLDLQFASVVVNYDLPWNPMVVEQRIGRVDRIGQAANRIVIVNLAALETIEDRILMRLYDRIGIFAESIGEIEPILGETVEKLAAEALRGELSLEEQRDQAEKSADAMRDQRLKTEDLASNTDSLMAADQSFLDEIDGLIGRRRIPSSTELHNYVRGFLATRFAGCRFPKRLVNGVGEIRTPPDVGRLLVDTFPTDSEAVRFGRMLESGPAKATFDQDAALKHANAELIHSRHPLVRTVTKERLGSTLPRSFALTLRSRDLVGAAKGLAGDFAFEIHLFDTGGVRPRVTLVPLIMDGEHRLLDESASEDLLLSLLDCAGSLDPTPSLPPEIIDRLAFDLESHLGGRRSKTSVAEQELNAVRIERLRATLSAALNHRVSEATRRLEALKAKRAATFSITMAKARLEHAKREREARLDGIGEATAPDLETELVAAGVLLIESTTRRVRGD